MDTEGFPVQVGTVNGHGLAAPPSDELARIEQAYAEIQRRDSQAEAHAWRWERIALALLAVWVVTVGVLVWRFLEARNVQAFVQVVQLDDQGRLLQVGIPQHLLAYTPPDGAYMDMLGRWVRQVRWRGTDPVLTKAQWAAAYRHTCNPARRMLKAMEDKEDPFKPGKKLVAVELRSVTKAPVPASYQVLWAETTTETNNPTVKTTLWTGTFSVGRMEVKTMADALENRLGICVTAYDLSPQPEGGLR